MPHESLVGKHQVFNNNIQVVVPSTPANYFHFLRRQIRRDFRRPLIVMSPKRLLRHKEAVSDLVEFTNERVRRMYDDKSPELVHGDNVRKVIFCSGNVYYDLIEERRKRRIDDIAILRIEQIAPFPYDKLLQFAKKYSKAELVWV